MDEREHAQINPSGNSQSQAKGEGRRTRHRKTYFWGLEIIQIDIPKVTQNLSRNQRVIQREKREKI